MALRVADPRPNAAQLEAAIDRVAAVEPRIALHARTMLRRTLAATRASATGDVAWAASGLTPAGYPVELAVSSAAAELRCVTEVVGPEEDPALAVPRALDLAARSGAPPLGVRARAALEAAQAAGPLLFGGWLGHRHRRAGSTLKLYAEAPGWSLVDALAPGAGRVLGGAGRLRFVGLPLDGSGVVEVYCRAHDLAREDVAALCGRAGLGHRAGDLTAAVGACGAGRDPFGGRNLGVSVALAPGGTVAAVAVFGFAWRLHGGDAQVRRATLAAAQEQAWPSRWIYQRLSAPLDAGPVAGRRWHGPVSFVAGARGSVVRHVGLAPPPGGTENRTEGRR